MNHKSILFFIAGLFCLGLVSSIFTINFSLVLYPEVLYACMFAVLVIVCIIFFWCEKRMVEKNKSSGLVKVVDKSMFIGKKDPVSMNKRRNLFMRVSFIAILGVLRKK